MKTPAIRHVRFGPRHLVPGTPEARAWIKANTGQRRLEECAYPSAGCADEWNNLYQHTLCALGRARLDERQAATAALYLARSGDAARAWIKARKDNGELPDRNKEERKADATFLTTFDDVCAALPVVAAHFEKAPTIWPFITYPGGPPAPPDALAHFLRHYAEELPRLRDASRSTANVHRYQIGPFMYQSPIDHRPHTSDLLEVGLLFDAVRTMRRLTGASYDRSAGATMPKGGNPNYGVAAAFLFDVVGKETSPEDAERRLSGFLKKSPGVGFYAWPNPKDPWPDYKAPAANQPNSSPAKSPNRAPQKMLAAVGRKVRANRASSPPAPRRTVVQRRGDDAK